MKKKILFVTKGGEGCDDGFTYALELARTLGTDITVLMLYGKRVMDTYEDVMAAVAFAEAGEFKTARELMDEQAKEMKEGAIQKVNEMSEKCREYQVDFSYRVEAGDTLSVIKDFVRDNPAIDMVLLSPALAVNKKGIDLGKLIKTITKPIVTITRPAGAGAQA